MALTAKIKYAIAVQSTDYLIIRNKCNFCGSIRLNTNTIFGLVFGPKRIQIEYLVQAYCNTNSSNNSILIGKITVKQNKRKWITPHHLTCSKNIVILHNFKL